MLKILKRSDDYDLRRALETWRVNSGVAIRKFQSQEKSLILAKCLKKMQSKSLHH